MTERPLLSVLIPTHRDAHLLARSLPVLLGNPPDQIEVIVLNNDPEQDVRALAGPGVDDPRVEVVEMGVGSYLGRALNEGIRRSNSDLVMLQNADLFPTPTYVSQMLRFLDARARVGAAIGKLLRFDLAGGQPTDRLDTAGLVITRQRRIMPRGEGELDVGQFDEPREMFAIDGAGPVFRRRALEDICVAGQYVDEHFVTQKEDHDLSWRLRIAGWECWYNPDALAYHGRTTRGLGSTRYLSAVRSFRRNEQEKSAFVRMHAMKNQWLMLLQNEDPYNFARDFPFILTREALVVSYAAIFEPRALAAIPMTLKRLPDVMRKRRVIHRRRKVSPRALRRWVGAR